LGIECSPDGARVFVFDGIDLDFVFEKEFDLLIESIEMVVRFATLN